MTMKIRLRLVYTNGDGAATLLLHRRWSYAFVALLYPFYIKSEDQLIYVLTVECQSSRYASAGNYEPQTIMLDGRRSRQDEVGGPKAPGPVHDYPQTDGYNVGAMAN